MEATLPMMAPAFALCLPVIDGQVPVKVVHQAGGCNVMRDILHERIAAGLPVSLPDRNRHTSLSAALYDQIAELLRERSRTQNWPEWTPSSEHIELTLIASGEPMELESGQTILHHYAIDVDNRLVHLGNALRALDRHVPGLGMHVLKRLSQYSEGVQTEFNLVGQLMEMKYEMWEIGDLTAITQERLIELDEEATEGMQNGGYDEDDIPDNLPSQLLEDAELMGWSKPIDTMGLVKLQKSLAQAGVPHAKRLAQLLHQTIPAWGTIISQMYHSSGDNQEDWTSYTPYHCANRVILTCRTDDPKYLGGAIGGFLDEEYQAAMSGEDYTVHFAVDRVPKVFQRSEYDHGWGWEAKPDETKPGRRKAPHVTNQDLGDGLLMTGAIVARLSAIDEALCLLKAYERTLNEH